ncbi:formin-like protein 5 [Falco naumanni]|uniref:formin-like protein 5 n=1 Tax=Falco naumanni TaxID=148594 RepID=UPI001ADDFBBF|nr:formin-like protein 5 [Falco naumanni]
MTPPPPLPPRRAAQGAGHRLPPLSASGPLPAPRAPASRPSRPRFPCPCLRGGQRSGSGAAASYVPVFFRLGITPAADTPCRSGARSAGGPRREPCSEGVRPCRSSCGAAVRHYRSLCSQVVSDVRRLNLPVHFSCFVVVGEQA